MKYLKFFLLSVAAIIVLALIIAAIMPKAMEADKTILINKPKEAVFNYIKFLDNQRYFGEWYRMDKSLVIHSKGTDGTPGYEISWTGEKIGKGRQVIKAIKEGEKIDFELYFNESDTPAYATMTTTAVNPSQTKVRWELDGKIPYPFNIMTLFFDMGDDFEKGLQNLKEILEQ